MGSISKTSAFVLIALILMSSIFTVVILKAYALPKTLIVPDNYATIQAAIDHANAGDTVFVKKGIYNESITIDKPLNLIGENPQETIIRQFYYRYLVSKVIIVAANNVSISGFTIEGGSWGILVNRNTTGCKIISNNIVNILEYGITVYGYNHIISGNNITKSQTNGLAVYSSNTTISDNNFYENYVGLSTGNENGTNIITNNKFTNNTQGLELNGSSDVYANNITDNKKYGIDFSVNCNSTQVHDNNLLRNNIGIFLLRFQPVGYTVGVNNVVYNNNFENIQQVFVEPVRSEETPWGQHFYYNSTDIVFWDNGSQGNYWSDYSGQGTYNIDENNVDHYPLMQQVNISIAASTPTPIPTATASASGIQSLTIAIIAVVVVLWVVFVSLLLYRRHRKTSNPTQ